MSFNDIFKDGFLESTTNISALEMAMTLGIAFLIGVFIYQVYVHSYQSVVFTKSFAISLVMMTMITALVIMAVTSNVVLSLGMVGALSIVRFRAAIKDPMDIVFMFFSIAIGIVCGAGFYTLAIVGSLVIGLIIYGFSGHVKNETPYLLIVQSEGMTDESSLMKTIKEGTKKYIVKSKVIEPGNVEYTIEVRVRENEVAFVDKLNEHKDVTKAMLISNMEFSS